MPAACKVLKPGDAGKARATTGYGWPGSRKGAENDVAFADNTSRWPLISSEELVSMTVTKLSAEQSRKQFPVN